MIIQLALTILAIAASSAVFSLRVSRLKADTNRRFDERDSTFDGCLTSPLSRIEQKIDRLSEMLGTLGDHEHRIRAIEQHRPQ